MRTVYLGTSTFAVDVLGALATSPHRPQLVVTPPDRPAGRGRKVSPPPVALAARDLGLELHQAETVNDEASLARIEEAAPDMIAVCQFGQLIKEPLLSRFTMLNVHPSVLPRWRGAAPIERAIMAGDEVTGVTIFQITAGLDSGPIALVRHEPIQPDDTSGTLAARLARARRAPHDRGPRPGRGRSAGADPAARGRRHLRGQDRPGGAPARSRGARRSSWSASCAR